LRKLTKLRKLRISQGTKIMQSQYVGRMEGEGVWRREVVPARIVGLDRDMTIYRATRKTQLITYGIHSDQDTFCPPLWWDLGIGSGSCGLGCRSCFLMLTFRSMRHPLHPVIYENVEDFWDEVHRWLAAPERRRQHTMGLGIDRSDSLLYEGVTGHARHLIPMFADQEQNPNGNLLVLLTKTANIHYLEGLPTKNVAVAFSLNPEPIADLWEGKWPDTLKRITSAISTRLTACLCAQRMGFETRWRLDPILTPPGWQAAYSDFLAEAAGMGIRPQRITLGTYREKNAQLDLWRVKWGLPAMEWEPTNMVKDGTHFHLPEAERLVIYRTLADLCRKYLPASKVALCKETHEVRKQSGLCNAYCNCLT
jgi:DNA repair photolyase